MFNIKRYIHKYNIYNKQIIFMGNISDKTDLTQHNELLPTNNWISQINAGGQIYDIATHHNITFVDGQGGTKTTWNGLSDIEVIIPSITDIVQSPIEFAGTVGADGKVKWNAQHTDGPKTGYLVFVTESCEFEGYACEAGDMAIYDGEKWNIVSGENQVEIVGNNGEAKTTVMIGAAQDVLTVEGKTLALTLDYADLNDNHLSVTTGKKDAKVTLGEMTVGSVGIKLNKADDVVTTIGKEESFQNATALANGTVNLTNATGLVKGINWGTFSQGTKTDFEKNSAQDLTVSGGRLNKTTTGASEGAFVDSVKLSDVVKFEIANTDEAGSIKMLTTLTSSAGGAQFFNGIHATVEGETADLTIAGYITPKDGVSAEYVSGLKDSAKPVIGVETAGSFTIAGGIKDIVTGWGSESTTGDVVSSVSVTANNNTDVFNSASVNDHVLSFGTTKVASDVTTTCSYKSLTTAAYTYTPTTLKYGEFTKSGFEQVANFDYTFGRGNETVYSAETKNWKLFTPGVDVTFGSYSFDDNGMKAVVPADTFVANVTPGELPTLGESTLQTVDVTGTVGTTLTTTEIKFNALNENSINIPGAYTLSTVETGGDITVGKSGAITAGEATIDLSGYITDVKVVATKTQE